MTDKTNDNNTEASDDNNGVSLTAVSDQLADAVAAAEGLLVGVVTHRWRATALVLDAAQGLLVTTAHALPRRGGGRMRRPLRLELPDGATAHGHIKAVNRSLDLAILAVEDGSVLPPAPDWGAEPSAPRVGELVLTVGRAEGSVRATMGVVSAVGGPWRTPGGARVPAWVDVDARLPRASAGGLLLRAGGGLLGWCTPALSRQGAVLPLPLVRDAALQAAEAGWRPRGFLGVGVQPARLPDGGHALLVNDVRGGSPAEEAGLLVGDLLLSIDDTPTHHPAELLHALAGKAGEAVTLAVLRGGEEVRLSATPVTHPRHRHRGGRRRGRGGWGRGCGPRGGGEE